jgi:hypothetical protein
VGGRFANYPLELRERTVRMVVGFLRGGARPPTAVLMRFIREHRSRFGASQSAAC